MTIRTSALAAVSHPANTDAQIYLTPTGRHTRLVSVSLQSSGTPAFLAIYVNRPGVVAVHYVAWTPAANPDRLFVERRLVLEAGDEVRAFSSAGVTMTIWLSGTEYTD